MSRTIGDYNMVSQGEYHPYGWFFNPPNDQLFIYRSEQIKLRFLGKFSFYCRFFQLDLHKEKTQEHDQRTNQVGQRYPDVE